MRLQPADQTGRWSSPRTRRGVREVRDGPPTPIYLRKMQRRPESQVALPGPLSACCLPTRSCSCHLNP
jgi:hypothetical protein